MVVYASGPFAPFHRLVVGYQVRLSANSRSSFHQTLLSEEMSVRYVTHVDEINEDVPKYCVGTILAGSLYYHAIVGTKYSYRLWIYIDNNIY